MVFSSMVFLWIFLPVVFGLSLVIRRPKYQNILLLLASLFFYAWGQPSYLLLLFVSILMNWGCGLAISRYERGTSGKTLFLALAVAGNLTLLGYFKYTNFILNTLDHLLPMISIPRTSIPLPVGISFFTFQAMSYVIDLYRGECRVQKNLLHMALYISFFPQLIAGPIVKYRDIDAQIEERSVTAQKIAEGFRRFIYGLGKKVIIANLLAVTADKILGETEISQISGGIAWMGAIFYTLQIYYDFSGYSDMAIGLGKMFGFDFLENFNYPYISASVREFWRRWHISLSSWFRDYLYIPLGGSRRGRTRTYVNLFIVFAVTGLWHGASWNFVGWGLFHGFFLIAERMGFDRVLSRSAVFGRLYTLLVVTVGWVFFRVESMRTGIEIVCRMLLPWRYTETQMLTGMLVTRQTMIAAVLGILGCGLIQQVFSHGPLAAVGRKWKNSLPEAVWCMLVMAYCILLLANDTYNPFIYYKF